MIAIRRSSSLLRCCGRSSFVVRRSSFVVRRSSFVVDGASRRVDACLRACFATEWGRCAVSMSDTAAVAVAVPIAVPVAVPVVVDVDIAVADLRMCLCAVCYVHVQVCTLCLSAVMASCHRVTSLRVSLLWFTMILVPSCAVTPLSRVTCVWTLCRRVLLTQLFMSCVCGRCAACLLFGISARVCVKLQQISSWLSTGWKYTQVLLPRIHDGAAKLTFGVVRAKHRQAGSMPSQRFEAPPLRQNVMRRNKKTRRIERAATPRTDAERLAADPRCLPQILKEREERRRRGLSVETNKTALIKERRGQLPGIKRGGRSPDASRRPQQHNSSRSDARVDKRSPTDSSTSNSMPKLSPALRGSQKIQSHTASKHIRRQEPHSLKPIAPSPKTRELTLGSGVADTQPPSANHRKKAIKKKKKKKLHIESLDPSFLEVVQRILNDSSKSFRNFMHFLAKEVILGDRPQLAVNYVWSNLECPPEVQSALLLKLQAVTHMNDMEFSTANAFMGLLNVRHNSWLGVRTVDDSILSVPQTPNDPHDNPQSNPQEQAIDAAVAAGQMTPHEAEIAREILHAAENDPDSDSDSSASPHESSNDDACTTTGLQVGFYEQPHLDNPSSAWLYRGPEAEAAAASQAVKGSLHLDSSETEVGYFEQPHLSQPSPAWTYRGILAEQAAQTRYSNRDRSGAVTLGSDRVVNLNISLVQFYEQPDLGEPSPAWLYRGPVAEAESIAAASLTRDVVPDASQNEMTTIVGYYEQSELPAPSKAWIYRGYVAEMRRMERATAVDVSDVSGEGLVVGFYEKEGVGVPSQAWLYRGPQNEALALSGSRGRNTIVKAPTMVGYYEQPGAGTPCQAWKYRGPKAEIEARLTEFRLTMVQLYEKPEAGIPSAAWKYRGPEAEAAAAEAAAQRTMSALYTNMVGYYEHPDSGTPSPNWLYRGPTAERAALKTVSGAQRRRRGKIKLAIATPEDVSTDVDATVSSPPSDWKLQLQLGWTSNFYEHPSAGKAPPEWKYRGREAADKAQRNYVLRKSRCNFYEKSGDGTPSPAWRYRGPIAEATARRRHSDALEAARVAAATRLQARERGRQRRSRPNGWVTGMFEKPEDGIASQAWTYRGPRAERKACRERLVRCGFFETAVAAPTAPWKYRGSLAEAKARDNYAAARARAEELAVLRVQALARGHQRRRRPPAWTSGFYEKSDVGTASPAWKYRGPEAERAAKIENDLETLQRIAAGEDVTQSLQDLYSPETINVQSTVDGATPLYMATHLEATDAVRTLLELKADPSIASHDGTTPAEFAVFQGLPDILQHLIDAKVSPNFTRESDGNTLLMLAAYEGHFDILRNLVACGGHSVDAVTNKKGQSVQHIVSEIHGKFLFEVGIADSEGLHVAAENDDAGVLRTCLSLKTNVDCRNEEGLTAMCLAAYFNSTGAINVLADAKADPNLHGDDGASPLILAVHEGHHAAIECLVSRFSQSLDFEYRMKNDYTALYLACQEGRTEIVRSLLSTSGGRGVTDVGKQSGATPLYIAAHEGHHECVRLLLEGKATVNLSIPGGTTPLYIAVQKNRSDVVQELLNAKANPGLVAKGDSTALAIAVFHCNAKLVRQLLDAHTFIDVPGGGDGGNTVAMLAAYSLDVDILSQLLLHGASLNISNKQGLTIDGVLRTTHGLKVATLAFHSLVQHSEMVALSEAENEDASKIQSLFASIDTDGDDLVSKDELKAALERWGMTSKYGKSFDMFVDTEFSRLDQDTDGGVSLSEFRACFGRFHLLYRSGERSAANKEVKASDLEFAPGVPQWMQDRAARATKEVWSAFQTGKKKCGGRPVFVVSPSRSIYELDCRTNHAPEKSTPALVLILHWQHHDN